MGKDKSGNKHQGGIGLFGGTFDPVHLGHLAVARTVCATFRLDSLLFIPALTPPHKSERPISSFQHRVAMLELALRDENDFSLSTIEGDRQDVSYTIDTLILLRRRLGKEIPFFFILGMDAFEDVPTWKECNKLLDHASLVIIPRPILAKETIDAIVKKLFPLYHYDPQAKAWLSKGRNDGIYLLSMDPIPVSSTQVRDFIRKGRPLEMLLPEGVAHYIQDHGLYVHS